MNARKTSLIGYAPRVRRMATVRPRQVDCDEPTLRGRVAVKIRGRLRHAFANARDTRLQICVSPLQCVRRFRACQPLGLTLRELAARIGIERAVLCAHLLTYADLSTAPQPPARARPKVSPRVSVVPKKRSPMCVSHSAQVWRPDVRIGS